MSATAVRPCAVCGVMGMPVEGQTVKALLTVSLRLMVHDRYLFCATPTCAVVYFAADQSYHFTTAHIREPVYQKNPQDPLVRLCYCFGHTIGDIQAGTAADHATILSDITTGIRAGQCACDLRNPQGSCCLGNVRRAIADQANHR